MTLLRHLGLWLVGIIAVPLLLAAIGLPEKLAIAVGTGLIFAMIAHIGASAEWKRIRQKDLLSGDTWRRSPKSSTVEPSRALLQKLETPPQRALFALAVLGMVLALGTVVVFETENRYYNLIEGILYHPYMEKSYKVTFLFGVLLAVVGIVFSFWYKATVARFMKWIRTGW